MLANDTDPNGDKLTAILDTATSHGVLTLNADGSFSYLPAAGFVGDDTLSYHDSDGTLDSASVSVVIHVYTPPQVSQVAVNGDAGAR